MAHTPGPWIGAWSFSFPSIFVVWSGTQRVLTADSREMPLIDDANLIAAAPELLDACRRALDVVDGIRTIVPLRDALKSAIAKAEGKS